MSNTIIIGVDEVGRGPISGPVTVAAALRVRAVKHVDVVDDDAVVDPLAGITDSKKLSAKQIAAFDTKIRADPRVAFVIISVSNEQIDLDDNILTTTMEAMRFAALHLKSLVFTAANDTDSPVTHRFNPENVAVESYVGADVITTINTIRVKDGAAVDEGCGADAAGGGVGDVGPRVMVDGNTLPPGLPPNTETIVKGDALVHEISIASVIAKHYRDTIMRDIHREYPQYGWETNVGYGTAAHIAAITTHGRSKYHRHSFKISKLGEVKKSVVKAQRRSKYKLIV